MPKMNPFFEEVKNGTTISAICRSVIENVLTGIPEKKTTSPPIYAVLFARG